MKNLLLLTIVAITTLLSSCVKDDPYEPPTPEDSDIVLNEIFSKHPDPTDEGDWVELYNKGTVEADISGYLINDAADPKGGFVIPQGTKIAAKGYYTVTQPELTVSISSGGEDVSFGKPDGTLLDLVTCPPSQADGTSFSRIPDGGDVWLNGTEATPGAANKGDASIPSVTTTFNAAPAAGNTIEVTVKYATTETVTDVSVFYAKGNTPVYNVSNKLTGVIGTDEAVVTMTDLNVENEKVSFFVAVTLDNANVYYYDKDNKVSDLTTLEADAALWYSYTPISGGVSAPTLDLVYSETPTAGYETVELAYTSTVTVDEARIYFAAGSTPAYVKANKVKGEDDASFTQTGVTISMANLDVEDAGGSVVGNSSDVGVKISFYIRLTLSNGTAFYYDKDGNVIVDDEANGGDPTNADNFKADPTLWNTYTNKAPVTLSKFEFPATPDATNDINVVLEYVSSETIVEARIYFAGTEAKYVKANKVKGEDDASFTQTGVTINMKGHDVEKTDGTLDGTTRTSGATIKFYARIATATSEYYFGMNGDLLAVDDSPADGAFDSSDDFKDDSSKWQSYIVQ